MKKVSFLVLIVFGLSFFDGCANVNYNIPKAQIILKTDKQHSEMKNYRIKEQRKEYVGSPILKSQNLLINKTIKKYVCRNSFEANKDIITHDGKVAIKKGDWVSASSYSQESGYYIMFNLPCFYNESNYCQYYFNNKNGNTIQDDNDKIRLTNSYDIVAIPDYQERLIGEETEMLKGSFSHELIYNGKDGNNIKVSYREYKDDMARPAFFQDLTYNLKESDIIRYKNYKIKVHKATNEEISYTVTED